MKAISLALISNAQSSKLIWLALGGNGITDKGAEHLAFALKIQHVPHGPAGNKEGKGLTPCFKISMRPLPRPCRAPAQG